MYIKTASLLESFFNKDDLDSVTSAKARYILILATAAVLPFSFVLVTLGMVYWNGPDGMLTFAPLGGLLAILILASHIIRSGDFSKQQRIKRTALFVASFLVLPLIWFIFNAPVMESFLDGAGLDGIWGYFVAVISMAFSLRLLETVSGSLRMFIKDICIYALSVTFLMPAYLVTLILAGCVFYGQCL